MVDVSIRNPVPAADKDALVAAYKALLQAFIDRRPSGMRLKIAEAIGKNKSFVSQITNPAYPVPVPARHLDTIFRICHFSAEERQQFLAAYGAAHPNGAFDGKPARRRNDAGRQVVIDLPLLGNPDLEDDVADLIREFAHRVVELAKRK